MPLSIAYLLSGEMQNNSQKKIVIKFILICDKFQWPVAKRIEKRKIFFFTMKLSGD